MTNDKLLTNSVMLVVRVIVRGAWLLLEVRAAAEGLWDVEDGLLLLRLQHGSAGHSQNGAVNAWNLSRDHRLKQLRCHHTAACETS